ncbi:MAG: hypothetical protein M1821_006421 [Bathelium mastoideum]|nr:MAG: hypothetical protein M1821_006421 [Bathelium mastoideum]
MDGSRLPLSWIKDIRHSSDPSIRKFYTLLDAAAYASTAPLDLGDTECAPDFTAISFNKIFGFPDLGALIVKKTSSDILTSKKYFGGGTVDMVVCLQEAWHAKRNNIHESLEDGTLPIHNIVALEAAFEAHRTLFGPMENISRHANGLAGTLRTALRRGRHANGAPICELYDASRDHNWLNLDASRQGPIVAFNFKTSTGGWIPNTTVEQLAANAGIHLRTGGLCNPGGIASALHLAPYEMKENFSAGQRCGNGKDIIHGKPTGVIRVSFGAMSTRTDVQYFVKNFVNKYFVEARSENRLPRPLSPSPGQSFEVHSLTVYPIKSCGGFSIEPGIEWPITPKGLEWDREWCVVHQGSKETLSQKRHPALATIRPRIDEGVGSLIVSAPSQAYGWISVPLSEDPTCFYGNVDPTDVWKVAVCDRNMSLKIYRSKRIADFFTNVVGTPCTLARCLRRSIQDLTPLESQTYMLEGDGASAAASVQTLANEAPILIISQSSLDELNSEIVRQGGKPAPADVFRANIVISRSAQAKQSQLPYVEDRFSHMRVGGRHYVQIIGPCMRCQVVCVDQQTGKKSREPLHTLARTRKSKHGRIEFGSLAILDSSKGGESMQRWEQCPSIKVGDEIIGYGAKDASA